MHELPTTASIIKTKKILTKIHDKWIEFNLK